MPFYFYQCTFFKKISIKKVVTICILITVVLSQISPDNNNYQYTINSRLTGIQESLKIIQNNPLFGVGYGAYLNGLAEDLKGSETTYEKLQPVHNIFLLLVSEVGLLGLTLIICAVYFAKTSTIQQLILSVVFFTGLFDHYWLTLIQNKILFTILLASFPLEYKS